MVAPIRLAIGVTLLGIVLTGVADEVIFKDKAGRVLTRQELRNASGEFTWEVASDRPVSQEAMALHQRGRDAAQRGDYAAANHHFEQASRLAPTWPYPVYDAAFARLLQGDAEGALVLYERVDALAPRGFFTSKTAIDALRKELSEQLPSGTYLAYVSLEWIDDSAQRRRAVEDIVRRVPEFAPAWKARAQLAANDEQALEFLEKGLAASPDPETYGYLQVNRALVLARRGQRAEAIEILGTLALDPKSPADIEAIAKQTLATNF